ncbi:MAG: acyltransferase family protein [Chitinivibrionales bacterium]|nr:acyltransferase family protein [Chitinivibrionales bacterium]
MPPAKPYFKAIDSLRFFAAVNIVLFHLERLGGFYSLSCQPKWFFVFTKGPMFHASLFFILGGFIFTIKFSNKIDSLRPGKFLLGRLRDLYPLHVITTLAMVPLTITKALSCGEFDIGRLLYSCAIHLSLLFAFIPFNVYRMNQPSWALSAFFFCYLMFPCASRFVARIKRRRFVLAAMLLALIPGIFWSFGYKMYGDTRDIWQFMHTFAPIRFFEFLIGMLLAQFYILGRDKPSAISSRTQALISDVIILICVALLYFNLSPVVRPSYFTRWISYHIYVLPLFAIILYMFAVEKSYLSRICTFPLIRKLGQSSFYPYLLHIPLISWLCFTLERACGYRRFLHSPVNVAIFLIVLYSASSVYWNLVRQKRRKARDMG